MKILGYAPPPGNINIRRLSFDKMHIDSVSMNMSVMLKIVMNNYFSSRMSTVSKELRAAVISLHQQLLMLLPLMMLWSSGDW